MKPMFDNIPDNHDIWQANEERRERELEQLPKCARCEDPIQQERAVCIDGVWYCDECLEDCRKEVGEVEAA